MFCDTYRHVSCWTEEIIVTTHLRIAVGICVLSTGLLVGSAGGAIATADQTESSGGAATGTQGTSGQGSQGTVGQGNQGSGGQGSQGTGSAGDAGANQLSGDEETTTTTSTTTTGSAEDSHDQTSPTSTVDVQTTVISDDEKDEKDEKDAKDEKDEFSATSDSDENTSADVAPTSESNAPASASNTPPSESTQPAAVTDPSESGSSTPAPTSTQTAAPGARPPATVSRVVVEPMSDAVASVAGALGSSAATFAALPNSETPITDVITSMQDVFTSVTGAGATFAQVSNEIYTLLGVSHDVQPPLVGASGALTAPAPAADEPARLFGPPTQSPVLPPGGDAPLFGTVVHASAVGGVAASGLNQELSLSGLAPLAPASVDSGAGSFFDHVVDAVLVPASLTALAAIALPGAGALLIVCGAGVRFGYRQAKAAYLMRVSGIARFAGSGPMGVVRSGSLITLHSRPSRADRSRSARAAQLRSAQVERHLERVA